MKPKLRIMQLLLLLVSGIAGYMNAQVKIGTNVSNINSNSLLEMESTNKGLLPPRVPLSSLNTESPLSGTVPEGMLVYSLNGSVTDGFYFWNSSEWKPMGDSELNLFTKSSSDTLQKTERTVLAWNDITLTLPIVTPADNGLEIMIKNSGSHTDLVTVEGNNGASLDGMDQVMLPRYSLGVFIAYDGNWILKNNLALKNNVLDVGSTNSWHTLGEAIEFLENHMTGATILRLLDDNFDISESITIDLPYQLTLQGLSFGNVTLNAATGLENAPMFRCLSDCHFKMLQFNATSLLNYGTSPGEDAIRLVGSGSYHEIKDCYFEGFYTTLLDSTDAEIWLFESDINDAHGCGLKIHSANPGTIVKIAETDFTGCRIGVDLSKGSGATIQLWSGGYYNNTSTDTAIVYRPSTFSNWTSISITGNSWNHEGRFIEGFDFARTDGRDASALVENNAGAPDAKPRCSLNVLNNATTTLISSSGTWQKANWTNTSSTTTKWTIVNNKITYQSINLRNGWFIISGNLSCDNPNRTISIGIVKNGNTSIRYGETTLRITAVNQPFQFSTVVPLSGIGPGDYFELYCTSSANGDQLTFQDILWISETQ